MDHPPAADSAASDATDGAPAGERRSTLRQYQVQLLERMQAAKSGAAVDVRELGVEIRGRYYLLDLTQIGEIVTQQMVAPVPLARPWYLGLANVRGDLTGVIDLARYLGQTDLDADASAGTGTGTSPGSDPGLDPDPGLGSGPGPGPGSSPVAERRLVTFSPKLGFNCALLADRVLGLRTASAMQPVDPVDPAAAGGSDAAPAWCVRRFDDGDHRRWTLLDLAQLVREPRFAQVGF